MYAKVPEELKAPLIEELKRLRLRHLLTCFPVAVVVFSSLGALVVLLKGHALIELLQSYLQRWLSDEALEASFLGAIVLVTAGVIVFFSRQIYRECEYQEYLYCQKCNAVDSDENGHCPVCMAPLTKKASFISTTYKAEIAVIKRRGLLPCSEPDAR
jgi:hypothetical protein